MLELADAEVATPSNQMHQTILGLPVLGLI